MGSEHCCSAQKRHLQHLACVLLGIEQITLHSGGDIRPTREQVRQRMRHELWQGDAKAPLQLLCQGLNAVHGMREMTEMLLDDEQHDFAFFAAGCIKNTAPGAGAICAPSTATRGQRKICAQLYAGIINQTQQLSREG